jgi:hypothetical protein
MLVHTIEELIAFDVRHAMFRNAARFVDYELVPGDILEFGSYTGRSLALLAYYHQLDRKDIHEVSFTRKVAGFDSFKGLPGSDDHPRWRAGMFGTNHSFHPLCPKGVIVTPEIIQSLFEIYGLPQPELEVGLFSEVLPEVVGKKYTAAAIVHIDCDLYKSTMDVLKGVWSILQEGTVLLFDDWFNFKGSKDRGEQKAFREMLRRDTKEQWCFTPYQTYATFGNSFIVTR